MKRTMLAIGFLCAVTLGRVFYANAAGEAMVGSAKNYPTQYIVRISGVISASALGPSLRSLIGNKSDTPFTLVGQCPTSNGSPNGWGMINLTDVGTAEPIFFNVSPAPPGSLPGLNANGFAIAERLKAQQIVIDPQMTYLNLSSPALVILAPADSDGSNWIGDIVNGDKAGFSAKVTEVTFELKGTKMSGW
jgi:hypothetical protein